MQMTSRLFLRPPDAADLKHVLRWMQQPQVHKWFDFGAGRQVLHPIALSSMAGSERCCMRVFGDRESPEPVGMVVLSDIHHPFRTASFWVVRDIFRKAYSGITADATRCLLDHGFTTLKTVSINAWAVETNHRSIRLLKSVGFREYGVQRDCHVVDGYITGRVHFELLPEQFYQSKAASAQAGHETLAHRIHAAKGRGDV